MVVRMTVIMRKVAGMSFEFAHVFMAVHFSF